MPTFEEHAKKADIKGLMITAIMTALAFTAAFFWNDAVKSAIESFIPTGDKISAKFIAAIIVTVIVVVVAYVLFKTQELSGKYSKELDKTIKKQAKLLRTRKSS